nr:auxin-induced protein X15 [Ipomoea batatas]GMD68679.1 auxin-induced protein X15 [Ipomoea batatas]GMD70743.1 auxin-induced protein X15 [Ipomoea batatas]GMD72693.1 auxin-induced protein X15 [Ipomoea batatas]GME05641.1 auxin-induced protein X15 [Ipomoea batatas]
MPPRRVAAVEGRKTAPRGHFVVYVGNEMRRFVVPTSFLKSPLFKELLDKAAEEYGFDNNSNRILLPCDVLTFTQLVSILR